MRGSATPETTPTLTWRCVRSGYHVVFPSTPEGEILYASRTRGGWEYGQVVDGKEVAYDETTRSIDRAKVLAERAAKWTRGSLLDEFGDEEA